MVVVLLFKILLNVIVNQPLLVTIVNIVSDRFVLILSSVFNLARKRALSNAPCANVTCLNGGECYISDSGPQCTCPKPYFGERCESSRSIVFFFLADFSNEQFS